MLISSSRRFGVIHLKLFPFPQNCDSGWHPIPRLQSTDTKIMDHPDDNRQKEMLDEKTVARDPIRQFEQWFDDAVKAGIALPEAMTPATCTREGKPSARLVLLKKVDERGFVFFTNYQSVKARDLEGNPFAALVFYWPLLERQVRIEGRVERTSAAESNEYFQTRARESQIGAAASPQSQCIESREVLEQRFRELNEV